MAAPASPNPTNLIMLAALGIGVYWFMTRRGGPLLPGVIYPTPLQNQQAYGKAATDAAKYNLLGGLINKGFDFFSARANGQNPYALSTGYDTGTFGGLDTNGGSFGGLSGTGNGWGLQLQNDGMAWNPPGSTPSSIYALS